MPIAPDVAHHYRGPDWEATRRLVLRRAHNACECQGECDAGFHGAYRCNRADRSDYRRPNGTLARVVLTVAHMNRTPGDDRLENLKAMCQICHLSYDRPQHRANAAATRREKKSNLELF